LDKKYIPWRFTKFHFLTSNLIMETHKFSVAMTCSGCSGAVTRILTKKLEEGSSFDVNLEGRVVSITSAKSKEDLLEILKKCGKEVTYMA